MSDALDGEANFGLLDGILGTKVGLIGRDMILQICYDSLQLCYSTLVKFAVQQQM